MVDFTGPVKNKELTIKTLLELKDFSNEEVTIKKPITYS